jgi:hypothetical protein
VTFASARCSGSCSSVNLVAIIVGVTFAVIVILTGLVYLCVWRVCIRKWLENRNHSTVGIALVIEPVESPYPPMGAYARSGERDPPQPLAP